MALEVNHDVFMQQHQAIEKLLSTDKDNEKKIRAIIQKCIKESRDRLAQQARSGLQMQSDPRGAAQSIRRSVYKQVLGAQLNIFSSRKAGRASSYEPPRKLQPRQRGGNRVVRGSRTKQMMAYGPHDRGMVLRWLNDGTGDRTAGSRGGRIGGNRGRIAPRNWFRGAGERELQQAVGRIATMIEEELAK